VDRSLIIHPRARTGPEATLVRLERWLMPRHSPAEEQYRVLCTRVRPPSAAPQDDRYRMIALTSAVAGEGKTASSVNLAMVLARDFKKKVLLLECDLKRPSLARAHYHLPGLVELTEGVAAIEDVVCPTETAGLKVTVAGRCEGRQSTHTLSAPEFHRALAMFRERFDYVVVDCPPLLPTADMGLISEWVDHILVVIQAGETDRSAVKTAVDGLDPDKLLGVLLNHATDEAAHYGYGSPY
jgi:capsular exopolysaccharide synthesis family protein